ncbi:ComEA family DNA-binding protein [Staphylococcus haemolyticus]|nr:helix-hairpin-helix domain-containing protein [Staphylococcus haemolyticus]
MPGVGPTKVREIIDYRQKNNTFNSIEDLKNIKGIGDKTFERIKEFITT